METRSLLLLCAVSTALSATDGPVSELCLGCLCEANTGCDRSFQCDGGDCGLFRISEPYWQDAGSPVLKDDGPGNKDAFKNCVLDPFCAARAVQGYMTRFRKDCNRDGKVDCEDFARLHYQGAGCAGEPDEGYQDFNTTLQRCMAEVSASLHDRV